MIAVSNLKTKFADDYMSKANLLSCATSCPPPPVVVLGLCGFSFARVWLCEDLWLRLRLMDSIHKSSPSPPFLIPLSSSSPPSSPPCALLLLLLLLC